jgi:hypothetical protein
MGVGKHYCSRGTLEQVKYGSMEDSIEDDRWAEKVLNASMSMEDSLLSEDALEDDDIYIISTLWGTYYNTCPHVRRKQFDDDYFWPDY